MLVCPLHFRPVYRGHRLREGKLYAQRHFATLRTKMAAAIRYFSNCTAHARHYCQGQANLSFKTSCANLPQIRFASRVILTCKEKLGQLAKMPQVFPFQKPTSLKPELSGSRLCNHVKAVVSRDERTRNDERMGLNPRYIVRCRFVRRQHSFVPGGPTNGQLRSSVTTLRASAYGIL
jgi:hypothetical protein